MHVIHLVIVALVVSAAGLHSNAVDGADPTHVQKLGEVAVDDYTALVFLQDPADDGKSYRVSIAIPKPWDAPSIKTDRLDMWLLARGGRALAINQRPVGDVLIEVGSGGATASAIYFFDRSVQPPDLSAVVVAVDGQPKAFKIPHPE